MGMYTPRSLVFLKGGISALFVAGVRPTARFPTNTLSKHHHLSLFSSHTTNTTTLSLLFHCLDVLATKGGRP